MTENQHTEWGEVTGVVTGEVAGVVTGVVTGEVTGVVTGVVAGEVAGDVPRLIAALRGEMTRAQIQKVLGMKHEGHFRDAWLHPALRNGLVEMTIPDKPTSRLQKYRLTAAGRAFLAAQSKEGGTDA